VNYRIVCGGPRFVLQRLALSTSLLERLNLTLRQHLAPLGRKSLGFCKEREQLRRRVVFFQAFYN
jgi:IS1 family transposase